MHAAHLCLVDAEQFGNRLAGFEDALAVGVDGHHPVVAELGDSRGSADRAMHLIGPVVGGLEHFRRRAAFVPRLVE